MEGLIPKLEKVMEKVWERFLSSRGIPVAGKFSRLLTSEIDRASWEKWLEEKGITKTKGEDTVPCWNPYNPPDWPVKLQIPRDLALKIVTLEDLL